MESCEDLIPDFDFLAPEFAAEDDDILSPATDMFSLGMLAFTLHNSKPLFTNSGSWNNYRRNCTEVNHVLFYLCLRKIYRVRKCNCHPPYYSSIVVRG